MSADDTSRKTIFTKDTMKTLMRAVLVSLLLLVMESLPVHAQSDAAAIGSAAAPAASTTSVRRAAPKYAEPSIGLELEYKVDNADVCVVWPEQQQDAACEGMDIQNIVAFAAANTVAIDPQSLSVVLLRYDNGTATISVVHTPTTKTFVSQEEIDNWLKGVLMGLKTTVPATLTMSGSTPGSRYDVMEINDIDALRFEVKADVPRGTPGYERSRAVGYILFGKHGQVLITAGTDPQHLPQTRVAMESIVKTVRMPRLAQKGFGTTAAFVRLLDNPLGLLLMIVVIAGVLTIFERGRHTKRSKQR